MFVPDPWQVTPPDGQRPVSTRIGIDLPSDLAQQDQSTLTQVAQQIVNFNSGALHRWLSNVRRDVSLSEANYRSQYRQFPGMDATWSINNGYEKLVLRVKPLSPVIGGPPGLDLNYDGYLAIYCYGIAAGCQFDVLVNGTSIDTVNTTESDTDTVWLYRFGTTALECQSLVDYDQKTNPDAPGNPNKQLFNRVLPARKTIDGFTNNDPFNPIQISSHPDLPLYPVYWWNSQFNRYSNGVILQEKDTPPTIPTVARDKRIDGFGPLNKTGKNTFRVRISPPGGVWHSGDPYPTLRVIGEFYSRNETRNAIQSWLRAPSGKLTKVNDKPLYFCVHAGLYPIVGMDFDLSPTKVDTTTPTPPWAFMTFPDYAQVTTDTYHNGYWRIGDEPSVLPSPPSYPWGETVAIAQYGTYVWQAALQLLAIVWNLAPIINGTANPDNYSLNPYPYVQFVNQGITDSQTALSNAQQKANTVDIYLADPASLQAAQNVLTALNGMYAYLGPSSTWWMTYYVYDLSDYDGQVRYSQPMDSLNKSIMRQMSDIQNSINGLSDYLQKMSRYQQLGDD